MWLNRRVCLWSWPYGRTEVQVVAVKQWCEEGDGSRGLKHLQLLSALIGPADLQPGATHLWPEHCWKNIKQASKTVGGFRKRDKVRDWKTKFQMQSDRKYKWERGSERKREVLMNVFIQCFTPVFFMLCLLWVNPLTTRKPGSTESLRTTTGQLH